MIKRFFYKLWNADYPVDFRAVRAAGAAGLVLGGLLGGHSFLWLTRKPAAPAEPAAQTAVQVSSVESEKELMSRFLDGLPELERALDTWFTLYAKQTEGSVWFLLDKASPALNPSVSHFIGCELENPSAEYPKCRGNVYDFYDVQCDYQSCSWTLCRNNEKPYSCTYSMNGYRDSAGRWENNCNVLLPQGRAFCEYLRDEKGFILNDIS